MAFLTFFKIQYHDTEFLDALAGKEIRQIEATETEQILAPESKAIEETTEEFIIRQLSKELKGHPFEDFVAHLLNLMVYSRRAART